MGREVFIQGVIAMLDTQYPTEWSTMKKLIWLRGMPANQWGSETLSLTAFAAPTQKVVTKKSKVTSCEVAFEPSQDLNGYSAPWPAGGGKNLCPPDIEQGEFDSNGLNQDSAKRLRTTGYIPINENSNIVVTFTSSTTCYWAVSSYITNDYSTHRMDSSTWLDAGTTYTIPSTAKYIRLTFKKSDNSTIIPSEISDVMCEYGTTPTTFAPYANICPISGWQGAEVYIEPTYDPTATPKASVTFGALSANKLYDYTVNANATQYNHCLCGKIDNFSTDTTYTFAFTDAQNHKFYPNENIFTSVYEIVATGSAQYVTLTTKSTIPSNQYNESAGGWILFKNRVGNVVVPAFTNVAVNLPSSVTTYNPYRNYSYGGTAEIVAGTGSKEWITFTLNGTQTRNNQKLDGAYNAVARWDLPVPAKAFTPGVPPYLCESLRAVSSTLIGSFQTWSASESHAYTFTFSDNGQRVGIAIPKSVGISTAAELDTWLSNNPITFCYEVATPTPYTFPPASEQLTLAKGTNYAWATMQNT